MEWLEADDVLGIKATAKPGEFIVATIDKDLRQIPGKLYNWTKGKIENISLEDADFFFFTQLLTGDSTDGIKGIPGVGQKRAVAHLEGWHGVPPDQIWAHCLELYDEKGLSYDYALQQARLVRILRTGEYDINRRKPILWKGYPNVKPCNYGGHREEDHRGGAETH
jgi:DNA polymerase-1